VSPTAAGCRWLGSAGRFSHRSVIHEMHGYNAQPWPTLGGWPKWSAQASMACPSLRGIARDRR
jgi:hypothetical protein